jgi:integrase
VHDFRRTFATRCAEAGMPMVRLANILGHSSSHITEKYYVHLRKEDNAKALANVAEGLGLTAVPKADPQEQQTA